MNGLIVQWKSVKWENSNDEYLNVFFPLAFSSTGYSVVGSVNKAERMSAACSFYKASTSSVRLYQQDKLSATGSYTIIAIGY